MDKNYTLEIFDKNHHKVPELVGFLGALFTGYDLKQWSWEFKESNILIAKYDDKLVGHYAISKLPFIQNSKILSGAKAEGSLIDFNIIRKFPRGSDRNVFGNLVKKYLNESKSYGIDLTFGFPNPSALPGQKKAGYLHKEVSIIPHIMIINSDHILKKRIKIAPIRKIFSGIINTILKLFFKRNNSRPIELSAEYKSSLNKYSTTLSKENPEVIFTHKEWGYLKWRYSDNPYSKSLILATQNDEMINSVLVGSVHNKENSKIGTIQEFSALRSCSESDIDSITKKLINWFFESGVDYIELWESENGPFPQIIKSLKKNGFIFKKSPITRNVIYQDNKGLVINDSSWFLTHSYKRY